MTDPLVDLPVDLIQRSWCEGDAFTLRLFVERHEEVAPAVPLLQQAQRICDHLVGRAVGSTL